MKSKKITSLFKFRLVRLTAFTALFSCFVFSTYGTAITWSGSAGDQKWNTATNWVGDVVPGASDDATIPAGYTVIVDATPSASVNSLLVNGTLTVNSSQTLTVTQSTTGTLTYVLQIGGGNVNNNGTINITQGVAASTNSGLSFANSISGTPGDGTFNANSGTLSINTSLGTGDCVAFSQNTGGVATLNAGGAITFTPAAGKTIFNVLYGNAQIGGTVTNIGSGSSYQNIKLINVSSGNLTLLASASITAYVTSTTSTIGVAASAGTVGATKTTTLTNYGSLTIHGAASGNSSNGIMLNPAAYSNVILTNAGSGSITLDGTYSAASTGCINLFGTDATSNSTLNNFGAITIANLGTAASIYASTTGTKPVTINNSGTLTLNSTTAGITFNANTTLNNNCGGVFTVKKVVTGVSGTVINNNVGAIFCCEQASYILNALTFNNYGTLTGRGIIQSTVVFNPLTGTISPGNAFSTYGLLTFSSAATGVDFSNGKFLMKVGGKTTAGTDYDQVYFSSSSASSILNGTVFNITCNYSAVNADQIAIFKMNAVSKITGTLGAGTGDKGWSPAISSGSQFVWANYGSAGSSKAPSVTTTAPTTIIAISATFNANLTNTGGDATSFDRGFCFKTSTGVAINDNKTSESSTSSTGTFSKTFSSLSANTQYSYKSYATNSVGTTLSGTEISFYTLANVPSAPTVVNATSSSIDVIVNVNSNSSATTFAIMANGQYVQNDGTLGSNSFWQAAATWGTKTVTGLSANTTYTFKVKALNGANVETAYGSTTSLSTTLIIPTVTPTVGTYTYTGNPQGPIAATNNGTGTSYTYSYVGVSPTIYAASSTEPTAAGTYTVTATVAADGNYGSASSSATAFSIEKATQTITFGTFPTGKLTGDLDFPPGATSATSGTNAITYTTSNSAVASISGIGEIHIVGVGTCTIYADQASSTNYNAATQASQSLTIAARPVLIMGSNATAADLTNDVADISVPASADLTIGATRTIHNITIERGGKVTLNDGYSLTVNDFNINSDASGTGTFVDMNTTNAHGLTVNGATNVQQYLSSSRNWYMSSPVSGASSLPTVDGVGSLTFYSYPESDSRQAAGVNGVYAAGAVWNTVSGATTMAFGTGYIVKPSAATSTVTFSGTGLNTGNQTISGLTYTAANPKHGFNLIGNPYPSYLNVLPSISSNVDGLEPTVWYRTRDAAGYYHCETVNTSDGFGTNSSLTGRVTGYIPPMQGFWVRTKLNNQSIALSNSNRSHTTSVTMSGIGTVPTTPLKSPTLKNETYGLLGLNVFNGVTGDETIIKFYSGATNNLDAYDSGKMSNGNVNIPELFTIVDGSQLAINTMNSIPYDTEIALGFTTGKSGDFTINASLMSNFAEGTQILLKDNIDPQNPVITDLAKQSYSFNSDTTTSNTSRFTLIFKAPSVATVINPESKGNVWISIRNGQIVVNGTANRVMLEVFNSVGQKVISKNLGTTNMLLNNNLAAGAYLVKLTTEGKSITRKIIID